MAIDYTTAELINEIKLRITAPTSQALFQDADFVRFLNSAQHSIVVPAINKVKEDYFLTYSDTPIVAGTKTYRLPTKAIGGQLKDLVLVTASGSEMELPRLDIVDQKRPVSAFGARFEGDHIVLIPTPQDSSMSIRFYYQRRPNNLTVTSNAPIISAVDPGTSTITIPSAMSGWTTSTYLDIIDNNPPLWRTVGDNIKISSVVGPGITLTSYPSDITTGMYVCETGLTPIPQLPYEAHLVIAQYAAGLAMKSTGDKQMDDVFTLGDKMLEDLLRAINPRMDGEAKRVVSVRGGILDYSSSGATGWRLSVGP